MQDNGNMKPITAVTPEMLPRDEVLKHLHQLAITDSKCAGMAEIQANVVTDVFYAILNGTIQKAQASEAAAHAAQHVPGGVGLLNSEHGVLLGAGASRSDDGRPQPENEC